MYIQVSRGFIIMMVFRKKQIVVLTLIIMIIAAGYLQYSYKKSSSSDEASRKAGEAVYVDNTGGIGENIIADEENKVVKASKEANEFFAEAKINKEITRSRNADQLTKIFEDRNVSEEIREQAYEKMMTMLSNAEKEMKVENLIKQKGYEDVFALIGDDGSIDVIVKAPSLNAAQVAQIADIVSRQANVEMKNIKIKPMY